jgi:hypothetical protein
MNYPQQPPPSRQEAKWTPLKIGLIIGGMMLFSIITTCGVAAYRGYSTFKEVSANLGEGGIAISSPPEVVTELNGPKKDYIGSWLSTSNKSSLVILENGHMVYHRNEGQNKEEITAPIAKFSGNNIECHFGVKITIAVTTPPHKVGDKFEMVVDGITMTRAATPAPAGS